ncbi:MAG: DoxX family protein [Myxococcota bacterium]
MTTAYAQDVIVAASPVSTGSSVSADAPSKKALWGGRVLSGIPLAFLAFDTVIHLTAVAPAMKGSEDLGWSPSVLVPLGVVQLICWVLYAIPRTAVLGAILWTGYLGGAVATHVRVDNPLFSHVLFPVYVAAMLWGGLWLRNQRLQGALHWRAQG